MPGVGQFHFFLCLLGLVAAPAVAADQMLLPLTLEQQLLLEDPAELARAAREEGDPWLGAIAFYQPQLGCTKCHETGAAATPLGPDLTQPREDTSDVYLVQSLLQPSLAIRQGYESVVVITDDGRSVSGLLAEDHPDRLVLRDIADVDRLITVDKQAIEEQMPGRTSIMPAGLANSLASRQQFLDLLRYVIEVSEKGSRRAEQLRPPAALYAAAPLPEYENDLDHAGLIGELDDAALRRGQAIYETLCVNCHGTRDQPGSLPTSLPFASGQFKRGSDPYSMYQTLTKGYGLMMPQTWMVPQQKYDVIHYIRESYVRRWNPGQYTATDATYLAALPPGSSRGPEPSDIEPWVSMDYGPHLTASYEIGQDGTNLAYKGIAIRLDPGPGGISRGRHWILFDHDTLRVAAAWSGEGFIDYNGILFNGRHAVHPRIVGKVQLANPSGPGWADPVRGDFEDPRLRGRDDKPYGPLPRAWTRFAGLYHYGSRVILSYTVGQTSVLEMPAVDATDAIPIFSRTFNFGPRDQELILQVAHQPRGAMLRTATDAAEPASTLTTAAVVFGQPTAAAEKSDQTVRFDGATALEVADGRAFDLTHRDYTISGRIKTTSGGSIFCQTKPQVNWVPDGKTLFVRGGRLVFDIGWVGAVTGRTAVNDGRWHDVAMTYAAADGGVRLYVDGRLDAEGRLKPRQSLREPVVRIGYTAANFPGPLTFFDGEVADLRFYQSQLDERQLAGLSAGAVPDSPVAHWRLSGASGETVEDASGQGHDARVLRGEAAASAPAATLVLGLTPAVPGAVWSAVDGTDLRLRIPAGGEPLQFTLEIASVEDPQQIATLARRLTRDEPALDLDSLTRGGPPRWPERLKTRALLGHSSGPLAVDVLQHPEQNPWLCRNRLTGFDFFPDGRRAAVCAWDGDVWLVDGIDAEASAGDAADQVTTSELTWQRIASGLFQPLGLKVIDGRIYVGCRDQVVVLHDLNGDGETDFYENFNSDHQVTEHFHEFAMGLQTDAEGNFYYAKSARHALPPLVPHHGTLLRISRDGSQTDILAQGFRAANGICVNPDGTFFVTDQEGHWMPKNRINWVDRPGKFYGNMWGYHDVTDPADAAMEQPLCWITNAMDRSPAELLWVDSAAWGPLQGRLLNLSYGYGKIYVVPHERLGGRMQGGVCEFPLPPFPTGIMRGRFHPVNGQLYACGMYAWAANPQQPGGFYRVRYTGRPIYLPVELKALRQGLEITFSGELDPAAAGDPQNYALQAWSLRRSAQYGSDHYDEHPLPVTGASLSADGRTVRLAVPDIHPTWCMEIRYQLRAADGDYVEGKIHNTIHQLGP